MNFCASVCEYNPLHFGHCRHLNYMKNTLNAKNVLVIMSGNFTQRGEPALLNKFARARQAVLAGADIVLELPTVFSVSNAEIFSKGAIKILNSLNCIDGLCFGAETDDGKEFIRIASILNSETDEFKSLLSSYLKSGVSFAKAKFETLKTLNKDIDENLFLLPNNILGIEYTRAILELDSKIQIFPLLRENTHNDDTLQQIITSAKSIRTAISRGETAKIQNNVPPFVYEDLQNVSKSFDNLILAKVLSESSESIAEILDCSEGLNNRLKELAKKSLTVDELVENATTKRYTSARIRRILISNLLGIKKEFVFKALSSPLYAKVLAINSKKTDIISTLNKNSSIPILTRKSDCDKLDGIAKQSFELDTLSNDIYGIVNKKTINENQMMRIQL